MGQQAGNDIRVLQVIRAIACLAVAQVHVVDVAVIKHVDAVQVGFRYFQNLGAVGVDIFFCISGFIVPLTAMRATATRKRFAVRRLLRIYPTWLAVLALFFVVCVAAHKHPSIEEFAWSATLLPSFDPNYAPVVRLGWALMFEIFFYSLIVAVWGKLQTRLWRILAVVTLLGSAGIFFRPVLPLMHFFANPILLDFAFGVVLCIMWHNNWLPPKPIGWALVTAGAATILMLGYVGFGDISEMERTITGELSLQRVLKFGIPAAMIVGGALIAAPKCTSLLGRTLGELGDASYSFYLTSFLCYVAFFQVWRFSLGRLPGDAAILCGVLLMAAVGYTFYRIIERPMHQSLQQSLLSNERSRRASGELQPAVGPALENS